jgi:hypothetical protein
MTHDWAGLWETLVNIGHIRIKQVFGILNR